jgi:hypothetical protein
MHRHPSDGKLRTAGYVVGGLLLVLATSFLEALAGWEAGDIVQSMGAAAAILILALIRNTARREARDQLWVTALWHVLIRGVARLIAWIHANQEEAHPDAGRSADEIHQSAPGSGPAGAAAAPDAPGAHAATGPEHPAVVERHGPWVKREKNLLFTREDPSPAPRRRDD